MVEIIRFDARFEYVRGEEVRMLQEPPWNRILGSRWRVDDDHTCDFSPDARIRRDDPSSAVADEHDALIRLRISVDEFSEPVYHRIKIPLAPASTLCVQICRDEVDAFEVFDDAESEGLDRLFRFGDTRKRDEQSRIVLSVFAHRDVNGLHRRAVFIMLIRRSLDRST